MHLFSHYKKLGYKKGDFPVSEGISDTLVALPFYTNLSDKDIVRISKIIRSVTYNYFKTYEHKS
jgi:dTDP-4-amino-4,6-dideoxygalactose transaminase